VTGTVDEMTLMVEPLDAPSPHVPDPAKA